MRSGKNLGDDLAEGKPTLPVIYALANSSAADASLLRTAIENGGIEDLDRITQLIAAAGGLEYTARMAQREKDLAVAALHRLPESPYRDALDALAEFAVARTSLIRVVRGGHLIESGAGHSVDCAALSGACPPPSPPVGHPSRATGKALGAALDSGCSSAW